MSDGAVIVRSETIQELIALTQALASQVNRLARVASDMNDDLTELARQHRRDVDALRESIRATDRVLADRTSHLA